MNKLILALVALGVLSCVAADVARPASESTGAHHQVIRPDQIEWRDGPPSLPAGAKFVVLEGDPAKEGFFAMRAKMPDGFRIPPHWHTNDERS